MPAEGPWIASFRTRGLAAEIQGLTDLQALRVREDLRLMPLQLDAPVTNRSGRSCPWTEGPSSSVMTQACAGSMHPGGIPWPC